MIEYKAGDIFSEEVQALVNTVNCVGVMGRGIALQFKNAFPENYKEYVKACKREELQPGRMFVHETGELTFPQYIINFPTKRHWRGKSRMEDIESGLKALVQEIRRRDIQSIAIPPLGCGLGGLPWAEVRRRIEDAFTELNSIQVVVFEPKGAPPAEKMVHVKNAPPMTPGRAALIGLIHRYLSGLLDPFITLLEVHKLMFFLQQAGESLKLQFNQAPYGPYAEELRHVLKNMEGHFISGYADGGDAPEKKLNLVPGAVDEAQAFLQKRPDTLSRFERVSKLVDGFETPFGLELLSSVYWVLRKEPLQSADDLIMEIHSWSPHKKQFSPRQIKLAADVLKRQGWLNRV
ncbi:MAG: macro domain-containing protein [Candidatus Omnitrophica bacterium]|nr:macro domain-containing protein [Candidatus Omnitrophota bacterium]